MSATGHEEVEAGRIRACGGDQPELQEVLFSSTKERHKTGSAGEDTY